MKNPLVVMNDLLMLLLMLSLPITRLEPAPVSDAAKAPTPRSAALRQDPGQQAGDAMPMPTLHLDAGGRLRLATQPVASVNEAIDTLRRQGASQVRIECASDLPVRELTRVLAPLYRAGITPALSVPASQSTPGTEENHHGDASRHRPATR